MYKNLITKISLFLLLISISSCNIYRKIPPGQYLLKKNIILVDSNKVKKEEVSSLIIQQPNTHLLGIYPIWADIYMFADQHPEKTFTKWVHKHPKTSQLLEKTISRKQMIQLLLYYKHLNNFIKEIGEPPVFIDTLKSKKSAARLRYYYVNHGYLEAKTGYQLKPLNKYEGEVIYNTHRGDPFYVKKYEQDIQSPYLKQLFDEYKNESKIKIGKVFNRLDFEEEKDRLTNLYRNKGVYHFQPSYIKFDMVFDTLNKKRDLEAYLNIPKRTLIKGDSVLTVDFVPYHIKDVNIIITKNKKFEIKNPKDSTTYEGVHIFSLDDKLRYKPGVLANSIFIKKGKLYSDQDRLRTHRLLMNLRNFKQVYIQYNEHEKDSALTANIFLISDKKFGFKTSLDITHSNIHNLGIKGGLEFSAKNLFGGAEVLNLSSYLMVASSKTLNKSHEKFFDVSELGTNLTLNFPRILLPFGMSKYIPKYMLPRTHLTFLANTQDNIGLDRSKYVGILGYEWRPVKQKKYKIDLLNLEFITNKRPEKYFEIYTLAFDQLQAIASELGQSLSVDQADVFIDQTLANTSICNSRPDLCRDLMSIKERKQRITQNIFIISNKFDYYLDSRKDILQQDFHLFNLTFELAGSTLKPFAKLFHFPKNDLDQYTINNVPFAEYTKLDLTYIKHWQLHKHHILAYRTFVGMAFPYGNSKNIPFTSSYFAGGSNDIRAWRAYTLGPGTTGGPNEFNEANLKLTTNIEYRFPLAGYFKGAFFADAGNIWNYKNNETDTRSSFKGLSSLQDIAVGVGVGLRVDFTYFVIRFDLAFKAYDPSLPKDKRWVLNQASIGNSVLNLGISYPF
jgi:hypothetical protein